MSHRARVAARPGADRYPGRVMNRCAPGPLARIGAVLLTAAALAAPARALAAAAAPAAGVAGAVGAAAAPVRQQPTGPGRVPIPIGGPQLAGTGTVVNAGPGVPPLPTGLRARSWLVADLTTGEVLAARAPHALYPPASTQKVLLSLVTLPRLDPTQEVTATQADAAIPGSRVGLVPGQRYTVDQLFTSLLVVSGNDAANALARANGGIAETLAEMNAEAAHLQAYDTRAGTVSGLDAPGQHTSAYDLALIARAALALPAFDHYVTIRRAFMPTPDGGHFEIDTHNPLLGSYPGTIGVKNGYTVADDATYIGAARRGGHTLVVTLLHAYPYFAPTAEALLSWGFAADAVAAPVGRLVAPLAATSPTVVRHVLDRPPPARRQAPISAAQGSLAALAGAVLLLRARVRLRRWRRRRRRPGRAPARPTRPAPARALRTRTGSPAAGATPRRGPSRTG